jgi:hypothetical protein
MIHRPTMAALPVVFAALLMGSCASEDEDAGAGAGTTGDTGGKASLRVEAAEGPRGTELIVYVEDGAANTPDTARGKRKVNLRCFDKARRPILSEPHPWPFTDTDDGLVEAHVHQRVKRMDVSRVSRCELEGTRGPLSGELTSTGFQ